MLKIGWGCKDVSTDKPIVIPGQFRIRISEGCHDPITLTALTIDSGEDYVIFLQCDIIAIRSGIFEEISEKVTKLNPQINPLKIVINATHTHSGPVLDDGESIGGWGDVSSFPHEGAKIEPSGEYKEFFVKSAAEAVCESFESRKNGFVSYGYGFATVAHSRRVVYSKDWSKCGGEVSARIVDGHAKMYGDTNDEAFTHYESGADSFANFVFTFDECEKLTGAIINIPCPSQSGENENFLSADYWHDVRTLLRERYGDIHVLAQCAAAGDLSPRILHYHKAQSRRYRLKFADRKLSPLVSHPDEMYSRWDIAIRVCDCFDEVYSWAAKEKYCDIPLIHSVKTIELDKRIITEEEYQRCLREYEEHKSKMEFVNSKTPAENMLENSKMISTLRRYKSIIVRYEKQKNEPKLPAEIHVIRLGDICFATNTFELYMDFQHRIQARSPFEQTFIVQLCAQAKGGSGSYIATERAVESAGYGATMYCNVVSPEGGAQLVEETLNEIKKLFDK